MMKPMISFEPGENIFLLIGRMKKVLNEIEFDKFHEEIKELSNYTDVIKIAKNYVNIV